MPGIAVAFGKVATIEIGTEVKILAKAMRKQLDRVCSDLEKQISERDLVDRVKTSFDELILLRFRAKNIKPFDFSWVDKKKTEDLYAAALVRISREYESRF